ncbi:MAG TPA: dehydratase, partial [Microvirga sp.]|nr:dehydratase [Microvirga sp.]
LGPSPGFTNLKWLKPVYADDTITYRSTITGARASASRPGWGMAFHHNIGVNQHGQEVFAFDGAVFWERRPQR